MTISEPSPSPRGTPPQIRLSNISKYFGGVCALDNVSFEILPGEVHCLAGENGCGKSTLIKIVTGVHAPEDGAQIEFSGTMMADLSPSIARRSGIAVIWQDLALFPHMSVMENIAFDEVAGALPSLVRRGSMRDKASGVMKRLGVSLDLDQPLRDLPISQRQIVAICRALIGEPQLIFMDEPTASLTQTETDHLLDVVRRLSADGVAVVFVSHRLAEVISVAERVTVLRDGRLVGVFPVKGMTQTRLTELMTGQTFDREVTASDRSSAPVVLDIDDLSRHGEYDSMTLTVSRGEIVGLTGLLGSGRTEFATTLFGLRRADRGRMKIDGKTIEPGSVNAAIDAGIAYVSEDRLSLGLIQPQSIADNMVLTVLEKLLERFGLLSDRRKAGLVNEWIDKLAIRLGEPQDPVSTLSGGNQQRVVLAKWLATQPKLLILDSPTVGVDVGARAGIFKLVRALAGQGMAILLISDEITEVYYNCDRILHMADGRLVGEYRPQSISPEELEQAIHAPADIQFLEAIVQ